jgi:multidrug efflux system membrane fusion protein
VTQIDPIDVEFTLPQDNIGEIQQRLGEGNPLPVTVLDRSRTAELAQGSFKALDNQVNVDTGTVRAKAHFSNPKGTLFANQFVNVRLQVDTLKDAIVVPAGAVRHGSKGDFVFVLRPDRTAAVRAVTQGPALGDKLAISAGLKLGERVITEGGDRLNDGDMVQLATDTPQGPGMGPPGAHTSGSPGDQKRKNRRRQQQQGGSPPPP